MATNSAIEWTTHTWNPWWGCVKVSEACRNCYAATFAARFGVGWGPQARRRFASEKVWNDPRKWNRAAEKAGTRPRVFCASMADVFEILPPSHPDAEEMDRSRARLFQLITETPCLDWLLLTKRPAAIHPLTPAGWWRKGFPENVWIGTTAESQREADLRIPDLLTVPAKVRFLSCEPLLGPLELMRVAFTENGEDESDPGYRCRWWDALNGVRYVGDQSGDVDTETNRIDWVIVGGESGNGARPFHTELAQALVDQCHSAGVACFVKQLGSNPYHGGRVYGVAGKNGDPELWPKGLQVRQFPEVAR